MTLLRTRLTGSADLYRVDVAGDGSCFFHAILLITDADYAQATAATRRTAVVKFREHLASSLTMQEFITPTVNGTPLYKDLPEVVSTRYKCDEYSVDDEARIEQELSGLVEHGPFYSASADELTDFLRLFLAFRQYLANPGQYVGDELFRLVGDRLKCDIYSTSYFLQDPEVAFQNRLSIIVHNIDDNHWEPIGQKLSNDELKFAFSPDDTIIKQLRYSSAQRWQSFQETHSQPLRRSSRLAAASATRRL